MFSKNKANMATKKHFSQTLIILCILGFLVLLYGCLLISTETTEGVESAVPNTKIASSTPLITLPPTNPASMATRTPLPAPLGLPPTYTPLPTYSPDQTDQIVLSLYENNPCKLPCWWGITPGKTSWLEAWQFLGRFATNQYPSETLLLESKSLPGYMDYRVYLNFPQIPDEKHHLISGGPEFVINIKTFKVEYIDVSTGNVEAYMLSSILTDYGKPKEIYAYGGETQIASAVGLLLYYPQYGFISTQFTEVDHAVWNEPTFTACFQKVTTALALWPPEQSLDFFTRLKISGVDPLTLGSIQYLYKVSNFDVDNFYKVFSDTNQPPCIDFNSPALLGSW
jgi:hypothetical protein